MSLDEVPLYMLDSKRMPSYFLTLHMDPLAF
jgi:hypothetical protein